MSQSITESGTVNKPKSGGNMLVQLISPGVGSSGVYPAKVLEAAATDAVFPAGTLCFADHPGEAEMYDRPERSIRDVAGVLIEDARWDGGALVAEVRTFAPWTSVLTEMADAIGVSIRASAEVGEADKATGKPTISRLVEGVSVDFVTRPGRGGAIRQVYEAARSKAPLVVRDASNPANVPVIRTAREALTDETRAILQAAVYGQGESWVQDFDPDTTTVVYRSSGSDPATGDWSSELLQDGYTITAGVAALTGNPVKVRPSTTYVALPPDSGGVTESRDPAHVPAPAGRPTPTPKSQEDNMGTIQVDEAQQTSLTEAAGRVPTLESERDTAVKERDDSRRELALHKAREAARPVVAAKVAESTLPATRKARIVESVLKQVTVNDQGMPNADELVKATEAEVSDSLAELAELAESLGVGSIRGFGGSAAGTTTVTEADAANAIAAAFGHPLSTVKEA